MTNENSQPSETYNIQNPESGHDFGDYRAESPADALDALARDAGYADHAEACEAAPLTTALVVTQVKTSD